MVLKQPVRHRTADVQVCECELQVESPSDNEPILSSIIFNAADEDKACHDWERILICRSSMYTSSRRLTAPSRQTTSTRSNGLGVSQRSLVFQPPPILLR